MVFDFQSENFPQLVLFLQANWLGKRGCDQSVLRALRFELLQFSRTDAVDKLVGNLVYSMWLVMLD
jgi:hypothetical protein